MNIEVRTNAKRLCIYVDDQVWAKLDRNSHSRYGTKYYFRNVVGGPILIWINSLGKSQDCVRSWKGDPTTDPETLDNRLIAAARMMIDQGILRNPDQLRKEREAFNAIQREAQKRARAATAAKRREAILAIFDRHGELKVAQDLSHVIDDLAEHVDDIANIC